MKAITMMILIGALPIFAWDFEIDVSVKYRTPEIAQHVFDDEFKDIESGFQVNETSKLILWRIYLGYLMEKKLDPDCESEYDSNRAAGQKTMREIVNYVSELISLTCVENFACTANYPYQFDRNLGNLQVQPSDACKKFITELDEKLQYLCQNVGEIKEDERHIRCWHVNAVDLSESTKHATFMRILAKSGFEIIDFGNNKVPLDLHPLYVRVKTRERGPGEQYISRRWFLSGP